MSVKSGNGDIKVVGEPTPIGYFAFPDVRQAAITPRGPSTGGLAVRFALMAGFRPNVDHPVKEVRDEQMALAKKAEKAGITCVNDTVVRMAEIVIEDSGGVEKTANVPIDCDPDADDHPANCICNFAGLYASTLSFRKNSV